MPDTKTSLESAASALDGTELIRGVQTAANVKITATQIKTFVIGAGSVSVASGKTATVSNALTLAGTDSTTMTFPTTSATIARTDAGNTFVGAQTITGAVGSSALTLAGATQTSSFPVINATQTWNNGATVFTAIKMNVTDTASDAASLLIDLQVGGTSKFNVSKAGNLSVAAAAVVGFIGRSVMKSTSDGVIAFNNNAQTETAALTALSGTFTSAGSSPCFLSVSSGSSSSGAYLRLSTVSAHDWSIYSNGSGNVEAAGTLSFYDATAAATRAMITPLGSIVLGRTALATTDTDGFLYARSGAGTPTGVPVAYTGCVPIYVDTTNAQLWLYLGGAWKQPKTPAGAAIVTWQ